jgi:hypothetical protein
VLVVARLAVVVVAAVAGCGPAGGGHELLVDLRTDFVPNVEFHAVRTELSSAADGGTATTVRRVDLASIPAGTSFIGGHRVAELDGVDDGIWIVLVELVDEDGARVAARRSRVVIRDAYALTVVITRDCSSLSCPAPAGDPEATECLGGACVTPDCGADPSACPTPECVADADCPTTVACVSGACAEGACIFAPDDALCPTGQSCDRETGCEAPPPPPPPPPPGCDEEACARFGAICCPWWRRVCRVHGGRGQLRCVRCSLLHGAELRVGPGRDARGLCRV